MGFTLRYILGLVVVLHFSSADTISPWERYVREAILTEAPRSSSEKAVAENERNTTNAILLVEPLTDDKPKTEKTNKVYNRNDIFTTESTRLRSKIDPFHHDTEKDNDDDDHHFSSDTTYGFPSRSDSGRFLDFEIKQYTPDYKKKYASQDFDPYKDPDFGYYESTTEYEVPLYSISFFDNDNDDLIRKHDDELPDSKEEPDFGESKDTNAFDLHGNDTKVDLDFLKLTRFDDKESPPKKDKNSTRKNFVTEKRTSINYNSSFNKTEILDDKPGERESPDEDDDAFRSKPRLRNYESTTHKNIIYKSFMKKNNTLNKPISLDDDDEDTDTKPSAGVRTIEATTHRTVIYHPTTKKNTVLTKPPALNNSHVPLLNNKIESETIKNIDTTTVRELTTRRPVRKETLKTVRLPTTRRSSFPRITYSVRSTTQPAVVIPERTTTVRSTTTTTTTTTTTQAPSTTRPITVVGLSTSTESDHYTILSSSTVRNVLPVSSPTVVSKEVPLSSSIVGNSITTKDVEKDEVKKASSNTLSSRISPISTEREIKTSTSSSSDDSKEASTSRNSVTTTERAVRTTASDTTDGSRGSPYLALTPRRSATSTETRVNTATSSIINGPKKPSTLRSSIVSSTETGVESAVFDTADGSKVAPLLTSTSRKPDTNTETEVKAAASDAIKDAPLVSSTSKSAVASTEKDEKTVILNTSRKILPLNSTLDHSLLSFEKYINGEFSDTQDDHIPLTTSRSRSSSTTTEKYVKAETLPDSKRGSPASSTLRNSYTNIDREVKTVASSTAGGFRVAPVSSSTSRNSVKNFEKGTKNSALGTTDDSVSSTIAAASTTTSTTVPSTTKADAASTKSEKEAVSYIPTKNTVINISKRGSIKFNSPTTELTRIRSTATPRTVIRLRTRPTESPTTENQKVQINPLFSASEVVSAVTTERGTTTTKRESNNSTSKSTTTEKIVESSTTEKVETSTLRRFTVADASTVKVSSTTIPQRRRITLKNFVPKIITPRYATTTTTTTTTTTAIPEEEEEEEEEEQEEETEKVVTTTEKLNVTEEASAVVEKDMNYTITDDMETSTKYGTEIESVMNTSFVVTSSTTEQYSYGATEVTEESPETSTAAAADSNLVPKVTEKTTTLNEDYEDEEGAEDDEKLPNQTDESEHSTHAHEPKVLDDSDNKEEKEEEEKADNENKEHKEDKEEEDRADNDEYTEAPYYSENDGVIETTTNFELQRPKEGNGGKIAAIVISCVGAICLVILGALLILVRKRQKRFTYGQRCTPVSLDAYSMDNVSVYNSVRRKGIIRASKRSYGNPAFEDPDSLSHPLNFPALAKFANNLEDIKAEFEEIPQVTARTSELPDGCDVKNRYANVIPLPETRVFLRLIDGMPNSDYINANYVTGPKDTKGYYIASQAPLQNTIEDFWRMVWEQQAKLILMLTHLFENGTEKCADYMPPSEITDCHRLFGDFQITLKKREVKDKYIISSLQLKNMVSNSWREVTHFWYLGWPEKGVPLEANSLIAFLIEARSYVKNPIAENPGKNKAGNRNEETSPIVVHCSPGTGRTGTVIACDIAIREFELSRLVDIPKIVYKIRRDRASSVQTKDQYAFIYKVISVYATKLTGGSFDSL